MQKRIDLVDIEYSPDCRNMKPGKRLTTANVSVPESELSVPQFVQVANETFVNNGFISEEDDVVLVDKNMSEIHDESGTRGKRGRDSIRLSAFVTSSP